MPNLFPKLPTPYFICSPSYTHTSSGVRTLHLLCHALNEVGQKAYIIPDKPQGYATNPALNTPLLQPEYHNFYQSSGINPIAVYPDITRGNPLNAKRVVRYLLAPAGAYGGDLVFPETDLIYGALPSIAKKVLRLPVSDPTIFHPYRGVEHENMIKRAPPRNGSCFYSCKYEMHGNQLLDLTKDSTRLCGTLEEIANILRKSEVCYLYEVSSILTEAALCGCPIVLVRTSYLKTIDLACMMGDVAWLDGEMVQDGSGFLDKYSQIMDDFWLQLDGFIKNTQGMVC